MEDKAVRIARKITGGASDDSPKVYVGTYAKYNEGSLDGEWVDLTKFSDYDEFIEYCNELHSDESDPELMFQDYEGFPGKYYSESHINPELWDYMEVIKNYDKDMVDAVLDEGYELSDLEDAYNYPDCYTMRDVVSEILSDIGFEAFSKETWESAFDYDHFGRELQWDMDDEELEAYEGMSDQEIGERYVDEIGGLDQLTQETIENYADLDEIGRMLEQDGNWIRYNGGYVQIVR